MKYILKPRPCNNEKCDKLAKGRKYCTTCCSRMQKHGDFNLIKPKKRKYFFNQDFLKEQSKESYWFSGWIASDGSINKEKSGVRLEICDRDILEKISKLINYNGPIEKMKKRDKSYGKKQSYRLSLYSVILANDFINMGIKPNKTKTIELPKIKQEFFYHFLRGEIEGDGSICVTKDKKRISLSIYSSSYNYLEQIKKVIEIDSCIVEGERSVFCLRYWDKHALEVLSRVYEDSEGLRLDRKYKIYKDFLDEKNGE